eukprot:CAMPEP_0170079338 /NCGR_PEP_ID=MMETSP0019_2-20121128/15743_1 /TAXON_ID=98059 /ORGANISM="Dinobryon sp., Strain UTEXLB2267" /LENGTH=214 /DNA_ID=CAMNT_0010292743 /DNA_START=525 /DNA_END=1166 /DNA_ORIENTATION=-
MSCLEELLGNSLVIDASTQIIKFAERKLMELLSECAPKTRMYVFQNRLRLSCQTILRNPLILATRLALYRSSIPSSFPRTYSERLLSSSAAATTTTSSSSAALSSSVVLSSSSSAVVCPSDSVTAVTSAVISIVRAVPRWGLQRATGYTSLAIVCCHTPSSTSLEGAEDPSNFPSNSTQLALVRALCSYCCSALTIPDPAGLLPLHAALKNGCW